MMEVVVWFDKFDASSVFLPWEVEGETNLDS